MWVSSDGKPLSNEMVEVIPLLRWTNEVFENRPTYWCEGADEAIPGTYPAPLTYDLAEWILRMHNAPDPSSVMKERPIQDIGVLLDKLDFLGRPAKAFNAAIDAALEELSE